MKKHVSYRPLPLLPAISGCIALLLRFVLYTIQNASGLLPHNHPLYIATLILAAALALLVGCFVLRLDGSREYGANFPPSKLSAIGSILAGICLLFAGQAIRFHVVLPLETVWMWLAFAGAACLILAGFFLWTGKPVPFLLYFTVCLYFCVHMICRYREWSGNPQTEDYIFSIFSCIFLALSGYYRSAFCVGCGQRRPLLFCGMMALFCCPAALPGSNDSMFLMAGFLWAAANLCVIDPPRKKIGEE